jgi:hypothetical protein
MCYLCKNQRNSFLSFHYTVSDEVVSSSISNNSRYFRSAHTPEQQAGVTPGQSSALHDPQWFESVLTLVQFPEQQLGCREVQGGRAGPAVIWISVDISAIPSTTGSG